jgi:hypothetical protein
LRISGKSISTLSFVLSLVSTLYFLEVDVGSNNYAQAQKASPNIFTPESRPYNTTYSEWSATWWQWLLSAPKEYNLSIDETGKNCHVNQDNPNVWFLSGTSGGYSERSCTIPAGKAILISPIEVECSYAEFPALKTESELRQCAKEDQDNVRNVQLVVDGISIDDWREYRVSSPLFNITLPENNILGLPPQQTQAVSDGYFIMLKPLPVGEHIIDSSGNLVDVTTTGILNFVSEVRYHISVQPN